MQRPGGLAIDEVGWFGGDLYTTDIDLGQVLRIDLLSGQVTVFATGFDTPIGVAFGPGGALFVSDVVAEEVWRFTPTDKDGDGCRDVAEIEPKTGATLGGGRNPNYFWDFYDVWTHPPGQPTAWERNKVINLFDILAVAPRFGAATRVDKPEALAAALIEPTDDTSYHAGYDRGPIVGANPWDRAPPDGVINIPDDILGVAAQFGHNCS
ncbi:MAG: hypothetical protein IIB22_08260 [Chloroflexi bacterium]|nr:hypothetical protein [Chloroflexota bacterium]